MSDLRQTPEYAKYVKSIGWTAEIIGGNNFYIKKFPLFGSMVKIQRPDYPVSIQVINKIKKKHRVIAFYAEPKVGEESKFIDLGFKPYNQPFLPSTTIQIDLNKSDTDLLREMHPKTRYNIKTAEGKVMIRKSYNIKQFADFWQVQARKRKSYIPEKKFITKLYDAFGDKPIILSAHSKENLVSELLLFPSDDTFYYMYAATNEEGRRLYVPTLLTWEAIKLGKSLGLNIFDFDGIYDERFPLPAWKGFTRFKKGFGGLVVQYPGAFRKFTIF